MPESRKKILCIEDDRETAALIAEELVERGFEVSIAHDGREGLAAILKNMPDLVLSDISMPVMSGFEVLERLTSLEPRFSKMPFVFLTALTDRENELKGRQLGADDYVTKPIDFDVLATIVAARLAGVARSSGAPSANTPRAMGRRSAGKQSAMMEFAGGVPPASPTPTPMRPARNCQ